MVQGVSQGFERKLQLVGVGYKAQDKGTVLNLLRGAEHAQAHDFEFVHLETCFASATQSNNRESRRCI